MARSLFRALAVLSILLPGLPTASAAAFKRVHPGEPAPAFTLPDLDGNPVSLESFRESPATLVVFWAIWSPRSVPLLKEAQRLLEEFGPKGFRVLTINADEGATAERVRSFTEENGIRLPVLLDSNLEEYNAWGVIATPASALLGRDLKVLYTLSGHPTSTYQDLREQIMKALGLEEEVVRAAQPRRKRYKAAKRVTLQYGLARTLFRRGQFTKALRKLRKVLKQDPNFPDAHALKGLILLGLAKEGKGPGEEAAREAFAEALKLDGTVPLALAGSAWFALRDGDVKTALEQARRAVSFSEDEELPELPPLGTESRAQAAGGQAGQPASAGKSGQTAPPEEPPAAKAETPGGAPESSQEGNPGTPAAQPEATPPAEPAAGPEGAGSGPPSAAAEEPSAEAPVRPESPRSRITAYLDRAEERLAAGDTDGARRLISTVVEGLLGIPERPAIKGMNEKMRRRMMRMHSQ